MMLTFVFVLPLSCLLACNPVGSINSQSTTSSSYPKIQRSEATVGFAYHKFLLLRFEGNLIALHAMPDPRFGWDGMDYRWYYLPGGVDKFYVPDPAGADGSPNRALETGTGEVNGGQQGVGNLQVGPLAAQWSKAGLNAGWLYLANVRNDVEVYPEQFERLEDCSGKLDATKWQSLRK